LKLLLGRQIALLEFIHVDLAISWLEEHFSGAKIYITGSEKGFVYLSEENHEMLQGSEFDIIKTPYGNIAIASGELSLLPELSAKARKENSLMLVPFLKVQEISELLQAKASFWVLSQEFRIPIIALINLRELCHHYFCAPGPRFKQRKPIADSVTPLTLDLEISKTDSGLVLTVQQAH